MNRDDIIITYFQCGLTHKDILETLGTCHDIFIGDRHLRRILSDLDLKRRSGYTDIDTVIDFINASLKHQVCFMATDGCIQNVWKQD